MSAPPGGVAIALELSSAPGSLAATAAGRVVERELERTRAHAADLLPRLGGLLAELGQPASAIATIVVGLGPGSFTALRVALASALGLGRGLGAALRGVPSFEALARAELSSGERGAVVLDARAGELYVAVYQRSPQALCVQLAPRVARAAELTELLDGVDVLLADDATRAAAGLDPRAFRRVSAAKPSAAQVLALGLEHYAAHGAHSPNELEPLYLRAFAATRRSV